jgi:putative phosphoesterase
MKIGVISDTHGFLDPKIPGLFAGVDHILHAGDIGMDCLIAELEAIAPVTAVSGNMDSSAAFPTTATVVLGGHKFLVQHIVDPRSLKEKFRRRIARERSDVVVFGHTHKAFVETAGGVLFFNPGYAGKPKHGAERGAAILHCDGKEIRPDFLPL